MNRLDDDILTQAAAWHIASDDDAMDWDGFTRWLEADPRHRAAYDQVALGDALLIEHRHAITPAAVRVEIGHADDARETIVRPAIAGWRRWAGAAIAASLAAALLLPQVMTPSPEVYQTTASAQRITLDDGSSVLLAPRSELRVAGRAQDRMALNGGALFDIRHDPDRQLEIAAGDVRISDIGTRFDVRADGARVRVEVGEGRVEVGSDALAAPVRLDAGKALLFDGKAGTATVAAVRSEDVGAWHAGRLSYDSAPLSLVAADLARYAGVTVKVPDELAGRRFSGTLILGNGDAALRDLSQVMGLDLRRDGGGYRLERRER
ncbi:FecR family protein [Novosphingobium album (ex Liu et al. 2023)]|uniref:FecR domain-containing protein n=1 Tax=Novosphingobium album (ex Liu et al. 2023) TaxID=3031130 RepID=A0ABT5WVK7_9SPHN|nr:FecR domain-containing protein [Novosphingobium album (ex Liu et al. 2023)]MDE8653922.1 FecR domain-containing protein [Novosphingobium album (ex Liu et al. 2023)]